MKGRVGTPTIMLRPSKALLRYHEQKFHARKRIDRQTAKLDEIAARGVNTDTGPQLRKRNPPGEVK